MNERGGALTEVISELERSARQSDDHSVRVGELIDALDERGYGAALAVLPLIELSPLGGIPGFPTLLALTLAIITVRLLLGYEHLWAPRWLRRRSLNSNRVITSMEWLKPVSSRIDARLHRRMSRFAGPAGRRAACIVILGLLLTVPPLEIVPFATSGPMIVIALFGLAMLFGDGLLMLLGFIGAAIAVAGGAAWLISSGGSAS
ncbi:exopolysaccharide biosynthesis protein [Roseivivax isoporae]|uniref:Exopolysaccharide biosynthesis protein n=1 Tax=Roseivivax isoporae LMG 25204 TaxID=1449351 RepID=X7F9N8_9RHOB|nr:exopolysaccharide biosynthesis protein [Roseivivax isoporae]ETX29433.1 hypothetical protein RISW2_23140 [Roseivivax isoporae LMG 25204]